MNIEYAFFGTLHPGSYIIKGRIRIHIVMVRIRYTDTEKVENNQEFDSKIAIETLLYMFRDR